MRIKTNLASMRAFKTYQKSLEKQATSIGRISSGLKIQASKDNPTGMSKSTRIKTQIAGYQVAQRNAQDGVSMMQTADGGLDAISESLNRLRTLLVSVQDTKDSQDKQKIQDEINQILESIDTISKDTEINGVTMLSPDRLNITDNIIKSPVGPGAGEYIEIQLRDMSTDSLGIVNGGDPSKLSDLKAGFDIDDYQKVSKAIDVIDQAVKDVSYYRTELGAISNRFELRSDDISSVINSFGAAESKISGADIALEMAEFTKSSILVDTGISMMTQTNKMPMEIMEVLNSMRLY